MRLESQRSRGHIDAQRERAEEACADMLDLLDMSKEELLEALGEVEEPVKIYFKIMPQTLDKL